MSTSDCKKYFEFALACDWIEGFAPIRILGTVSNWGVEVPLAQSPRKVSRGWERLLTGLQPSTLNFSCLHSRFDAIAFIADLGAGGLWLPENREDGANPSRSRRCNRGRTLRTPLRNRWKRSFQPVKTAAGRCSQ
jgi:hypothetical protein